MGMRNKDMWDMCMPCKDMWSLRCKDMWSLRCKDMWRLRRKDMWSLRCKDLWSMRCQDMRNKDMWDMGMPYMHEQNHNNVGHVRHNSAAGHVFGLHDCDGNRCNQSTSRNGSKGDVSRQVGRKRKRRCCYSHRDSASIL